MEIQIGNASYRNEAWEEAKQGRRYAFFREDSVLSKAKSEKAGRPIYEPVILLEQLIPGDSLNKPVRPMRESDKDDFPQEWARFQAKMDNQIPGTPLAAVSWLHRTQIAEYNALNIFTVEQLATLPESVASRIMGFHKIRGMAENFLKAAESSAHMEQLASDKKAAVEEKEAANARITELEAQVKELLAASKNNTLSLPKK